MERQGSLFVGEYMSSRRKLDVHVCMSLSTHASHSTQVCVHARMLQFTASSFMLLWVWAREWQSYSGVKCVAVLSPLKLSVVGLTLAQQFTHLSWGKDQKTLRIMKASVTDMVCVCVWEREITRGRRDSVNKRQKRFIKTPPQLTILLSFYSPCPSPPPPYLHFSQPEKWLHAPVSLVFHLSLWRGEEWRSFAACNYTERSWMRASVATKKSNSHPSHHPKYLLVGGDTKKGI